MCFIMWILRSPYHLHPLAFQCRVALPCANLLDVDTRAKEQLRQHSNGTNRGLLWFCREHYPNPFFAFVVKRLTAPHA